MTAKRRLSVRSSSFSRRTCRQPSNTSSLVMIPASEYDSGSVDTQPASSSEVLAILP